MVFFGIAINVLLSKLAGIRTFVVFFFCFAPKVFAWPFSVFYRSRVLINISSLGGGGGGKPTPWPKL